MKVLVCLFTISTVVSGGFLNGGHHEDFNGGNGNGHSGSADIVPVIAALYGNDGHVGGEDYGEDIGGDYGGLEGNGHSADIVPVIAALYGNGGHVGGDVGSFENRVDNGHLDSDNLGSIIAGVFSNGDLDSRADSEYVEDGHNSAIVPVVAALFGHNDGLNSGYDDTQSAETYSDAGAYGGWGW